MLAASFFKVAAEAVPFCISTQETTVNISLKENFKQQLMLTISLFLKFSWDIMLIQAFISGL